MDYEIALSRITGVLDAETNKLPILVEIAGLDPTKDLIGLPFPRAFLANQNLSKFNLSECNLESAYLQDADLPEAHLESANLKGAHLESANLRGANLEGANLAEANLQDAVRLTQEQLDYPALADKLSKMYQAGARRTKALARANRSASEGQAGARRKADILQETINELEERLANMRKLAELVDDDVTERPRRRKAATCA